MEQASMTVNNQNSSNNNKQLCVKQNQNQRKDNKIKRVDEQIHQDLITRFGKK